MTISVSPQKISPTTEWVALGCAIGGIFNISLGFFMIYGLGLIGAWALVALGILVSVIGFGAFIHSRLERFASEEQITESRLSENRKVQLFESEIGTGERTRIWIGFEKWGTSLLTILLSILSMSAAIYFFQLSFYDSTDKISAVLSPRFSYGILLGSGAIAFVLVIFGRFASGLGFTGKQSQLRTPSGLTLLNGYATLLITAILAIFKIGVDNGWDKRDPDSLILWIFIPLMILLSIDWIASLLLALYRPHSTQSIAVPNYESHLTSLLASSDGAWSAMADMIEYQFGFKIDRSQIVKFTQLIIIPLLIIQLITLSLISIPVVVPQGKIGFIERFGALRGEALETGLHFKWPWPCESVRIVEFGKIESLTIGTKPEKNHLWTSKGMGESLIISENGKLRLTRLAGTEGTIVEDFVEPVLEIQYRIINPRLFHYSHANPIETLRLVSENAFITLLTQVEGAQLLTNDPTPILTQMREQIQKETNQLNLGLEIGIIGFIQIQPPSIEGVTEAFRKVAASQIDGDAKIIKSEATAIQLIAEAGSLSTEIRCKADSYATKNIAEITAEAGLFESRSRLWDTYQRLYREFSYYNVMEHALLKPRKTVLAIQNPDAIKHIVTQLDLKVDLGMQMLEAASANENEKEKESK